MALVRVEQVYPFPVDELRELLDGYPKLREVCWVQEEPENMGAWEFARPLLEQLIDGRWPLRYIGRVRNSSPRKAPPPGTPSTSAPSSNRRSRRSRRPGGGPGAVEASVGFGRTKLQVRQS